MRIVVFEFGVHNNKVSKENFCNKNMYNIIYLYIQTIDKYIIE